MNGGLHTAQHAVAQRPSRAVVKGAPTVLRVRVMRDRPVLVAGGYSL